MSGPDEIDVEYALAAIRARKLAHWRLRIISAGGIDPHQVPPGDHAVALLHGILIVVYQERGPYSTVLLSPAATHVLAGVPAGDGSWDRRAEHVVRQLLAAGLLVRLGVRRGDRRLYRLGPALGGAP